jgi:hypothetical protein
VLPHAGGKGPKIAPCPMQRDLVPSEVRKIWEIGGRDEAKLLLRFETQHALIHGVSGKSLDHGTLVKDLAGPFQEVVWLEGANDTTGYIYAGQHRTAALELVLKATLAELAKVNKKLGSDKENPGLLTKKRNLVKILQDKGTWLIAYYDTGKCI